MQGFCSAQFLDRQTDVWYHDTMSIKQEIITNLRERIGAIERMRNNALNAIDTITAYPLGIAAIDGALKHGGIMAAASHEISAPHHAAALGFILMMVSSMVKKGPVMWCAAESDFYTPGFARFGINDTDIMFVESKDPQQLLWATETGLSCEKISAVVLAAKTISLAQGRRLKLLAQKHNTTALFITKRAQSTMQTNACTRWLIEHEPSVGLPSRNGIKCVGAPRLSITLLRNLYGQAPLSWTVEFDESALRFHTVPSLRSSTRQDAPPPTAHRPRERTA